MKRAFLASLLLGCCTWSAWADPITIQITNGRFERTTGMPGAEIPEPTALLLGGDKKTNNQ